MKARNAVLIAAIALLTVPVDVIGAEPTPPPDGPPPRVGVTVSSWSSSGGRGYVGVTASGHWAPAAVSSSRVRTEFYSRWVPQGAPAAYTRVWWVTVIRRADDSVVNFGSPIVVHTNADRPGIGLEPTGFGDLSLYLEVGVEPVTAPARTERDVSAELTAGWRDWVDDAIAAYVRRDSIRVVRWTFEFGDGARRTFPGDGTDRLSTTHAYDAGEYEAIVTARVTGEAYGAFFAPDGTPYEEVVPFSLDISNRAPGIAGLPIEYVPPVVSVGASPSGVLPSGPIEPDTIGHAAIWWPRGLPCELHVRPIVEAEGFIRSGGVVIGGATTRLAAYRFEGGPNDARDGSPPGAYPSDEPLRLQWNTPLPNRGMYPVSLVLELETTYDDGEVRTSTVSGEVAVGVIYSSISG